MTLIIGIKCQDGIVVGADGAATFGVMGQQTARQPTKRKLYILSEQIVVGVSGPVGLGQRISGEVERSWAKGEFSKPGTKPHDVMAILREKAIGIIEREFNISVFFSQKIPGAMEGALSATIIAMPVSLQPQLFQLDYQGSPEMATDDLPFVAIGSGQMIADPFLAFVRRVFWQEKVPTLEQGRFAAVWALRHAALTAPGGIGLPFQVATLTKSSKGSCDAAEVPEREWQEQLQAIDAYERQLPDLLANASGAGADGDEANAPPSKAS